MTEENLDILATKIAERMCIPPRWMKLTQATQYSSIGKSRLINLTKRGLIDGFQDSNLKTKPWIFDKKSIDNYRSFQLYTFHGEMDEAKKFARDIMASLSDDMFKHSF